MQIISKVLKFENHFCLANFYLKLVFQFCLEGLRRGCHVVEETRTQKKGPHSQIHSSSSQRNLASKVEFNHHFFHQ